MSAPSLFDLVVVVLACVLVRASSDCPGTSSDAQGQDHQEVLRDLAWEVLSDLSSDVPGGAVEWVAAKTSRRSV